MMDLYLDKPLVKEAAFAARLSETAENWPQELQSELLKKLPFLSDYELMVNLERVDTGRGFGFGYADVSNKTERPEPEHAQTDLPHVRIPIIIQERSVKPFSVFVNGESVLPLTEDRVREALFNPATFDLSTIQPRDPSLVEPFMPPHRSGIGMGGEYKMASVKRVPRKLEKTAEMRSVEKYYGDGGLQEIVDKWMEEYHRLNKKPMKKEASVCNVVGGIDSSWLSQFEGTPLLPKAIAIEEQLLSGDKEDIVRRLDDQGHWQKRDLLHLQKRVLELELVKSKSSSTLLKQSSLLLKIAPTIRESDVKMFTEKLASDPSLIAGFRRNGLAPVLVEVFDNTKRASADERLLALAERIEPTCVTLHKLPGGNFLVKSANTAAFQPPQAKGEVVPAEEAAQAVGPENAQAMQPGQTATAVSKPVEAKAPSQSKAKVIEEFGQYEVQDLMANKLVGHVFPQSLSWDGSFSPQPVAIFTNGSVYAMQDQICGELIGKGTKLPSETPRGDGVFYTVDGGEGISTMPVTVASAAQGVDGIQRFNCSDPFGNQFSVMTSPGLNSPQRVSDTEYALPSNWKFMRLNEQTELVQDPTQMDKTSSARGLRNSITLFWNGAFNIEGGCGLEKISSDFRYNLDPVSAEFMLGVLGVDGRSAKQKVAEARRKGEVKLAGLKTIYTLAERYEEATKTASALAPVVQGLRRDLIKEAADIEDKNTANDLLALNFINPENVATFVGYIPELAQTSEKLAEMLLASYLGQQEIDEEPVERAMRNMEDVISNLRALSQEA